MSLPKLGCFIGLLVIFYGCGMIKIGGTTQGLTSYYKKTQVLEPELFIKPSSIEKSCQLINNNLNKVIVINGVELKKCISTYPKAMIYIWEPKCRSKLCPDLNILQQNCDKRSIELFIVAQYYDYRLMKKQYSIKRSIIGVDVKHYSSNFTSRYMKKFLRELIVKHDTVPISGKMLLLNYGVLKTTTNSISQLDSLL